MPSTAAALPAILLASTVACEHASASELPASAFYDVKIETSLPHLEENLRYATVRYQDCLTRSEIFSIFPSLSSPALADCALQEERRDDAASTWLLNCRTGTTGQASWQIAANHLVGALHVKLGGKNMTFSQRATLQRVGQCVAD